jgi:hypothetical protein
LLRWESDRRPEPLLPGRSTVTKAEFVRAATSQPFTLAALPLSAEPGRAAGGGTGLCTFKSAGSGCEPWPASS